MKRILWVLLLAVLWHCPPVRGQSSLTAKDYFERGYALAAKGDWDGAIAAYTKVIELAPNNSSGAYNNRGNARKKKEDWDGAIADFTKAIDLVPEWALPHCNRGLTNYIVGNFQLAIADFQKAIKLDPTKKEEMTRAIHMAYEDWGKDFPPGAPRLPEDFPQQTPEDLAQMFAQQKAIAMANEESQKIVLPPTPALDAIKMAEDMLKSEEFRVLEQPAFAPMVSFPLDKQAQSLEKGTAEGTAKRAAAEKYVRRAIEREEKGDTDGALADYAEAIKTAPYYADAYYNRGLTWYGLSKWSAATADFSKAIELDPQFAHAYYNRGLTRYRVGAYQGAVADWEKTIQLDPSQKSELSPWIAKAQTKLKEAR